MSRVHDSGVGKNNGQPFSQAPVIPRRVLIVDDDEATCNQLKALLETNPSLQVTFQTDGQKALDELTQADYSVAITDLRMPKLDGMELIKEIQRRRLSVSMIVTTGYGSIDEAVQAIRMGATDFLTKPIDVDHLRRVIDRALRERALLDEVAHLRLQLETTYTFQNILSKNPRMHAVFELISNVGDTNTTVLIEGETGTGKEQVARAIHGASNIRSGPLVAVNCAALPETLLESELFGHEKGAFTGAVNQRPGRFELAHGGTIFLDEIGDVPATMQAKLLRVLQERSFERIGGSKSIQVDVRVIAATNRSLQKMVEEGKFREDLFYRLNVIKILLPPLRERPEDIPLLATHFTMKFTRANEPPKKIPPDVMEVLLNYSWPGNIRELENAIERACVTSRGAMIELQNLPPDLVNPPTSKPVVDLDRPLALLVKENLAQIEEQYIRKALQKTQGHIGRCARICGLSRRTITTKIAEYHLDKSVFKMDDGPE
jgi:DNA-binding NtrC family response regulator